MYPGDLGQGSGTAHLGGLSPTCSSNWYVLYLYLWSLLELWGRPDYEEDNDVGGVGWQSGFGEAESK